jgi:cellulose biosynthesis protein BcsQ
MVVSIASMKGGVGKSTLAAMLAKHIASSMYIPVTVVDMDPQRGATILLLGPQKTASHKGPSTYDVLKSELDKIPSQEILAQAVVPSSYHNRVRILPASAALARLSGPDIPRSLLRLALCESPYPQDPLIIIDTGPDLTLCEMSLAAADLAFIPVTLSHQTGVPTLNTLQAAFRLGCPIGGLIPTMAGNAKWGQQRMAQWRQSLRDTQLVKSRKIRLLPAMPYSQSAVRGTWRWGKLPNLFLPTLEGIRELIFSDQAPMCEASTKEPVSSVDMIEGIADHG